MYEEIWKETHVRKCHIKSERNLDFYVSNFYNTAIIENKRGVWEWEKKNYDVL